MGVRAPCVALSARSYAALHRIDSTSRAGTRATASVAAAAVPLGAIAHLIPPVLDLSDPLRGFAEVAGALSGSGSGRPRVLLVDDLQWLDAASAVLLRQLMDADVARLVGTVRTGERVESIAATAVKTNNQKSGGPVARTLIRLLAPVAMKTFLTPEKIFGPVHRRRIEWEATAV